MRTRPSFAHVWIECAGAPRLATSVPNPETDATREGTAAHWVALQVIQGRQLPSHTPEGWPISDEMIRGAHLYAEVLRPRMAASRGVAHFEFMVGLTAPGARRLPTTTAGTPDWWMFDGGVLDVADYKFGYRPVSPYENPQLVTYAAHILDQIDDIDFNLRLRFTIVQPRDYSLGGRVKTWECNGADIRGMVNRLKAKADEAQTPTAGTRAGPWCLDCPARGHCETLRVAAAGAADYVAATQLINLTPRQVGHELTLMQRQRAIFDAHLEGLESLAEAFEKNGQGVPGFEMKEGRRVRAWTVPKDQVIRLGQMAGHSLAKPAEPITPTQAIDAGVPESFVGAISKRLPGKRTLQPIDHSEVERIFKHD